MIPVITKSLIKKAENYFINETSEISRLIIKNGSCTLFERKYNPFQSLIRSIISQQLSNKASQSIFSRLLAKSENKEVLPENIILYTIEDLKAIGISNAKSKYIISLSKEVMSGNLDFEEMSILNDNDVINNLIKYNGIGRWTAEMFLIFSLGRPDVVSLNDAGIIRATQKAYKLESKPSSEELISISDTWKPYRSIACWHLWKSLD